MKCGILRAWYVKETGGNLTEDREGNEGFGTLIFAHLRDHCSGAARIRCCWIVEGIICNFRGGWPSRKRSRSSSTRYAWTTTRPTEAEGEKGMRHAARDYSARASSDWWTARRERGSGLPGPEFDGVAEEVGKDLSQGGLVAVDNNDVFEFNGTVGLRGLEVGVGLDHSAKQGGEVHGAEGTQQVPKLEGGRGAA